MLARDDLRVCLVDKDRFPSDTPSTHGIQPAGVQILESIGVLDPLGLRLPHLVPTLLRFF
jgi:2-polyprenyl-6-methoxyphenol hydroxylase-like FAD-dependent oxidoreductase